MAGQFWSPAEEGGYLYSDELSDYLRAKLQPLCKFRQFADAEMTEKGLHRGAEHRWNSYTDIDTQGDELSERDPIPESSFRVKQKLLVVTEYGNSVPYTGKLEMLGKQDLIKIIDQTLKNDARKTFDFQAWFQFNRTPLRVTPVGGNSTTALSLVTNGIPVTTNNIEFRKQHSKLMTNLMRERDIPAYVDDDYVFISRPTTFSALKDDLESVYQYTESGMKHVFEGEIGRYDSARYVEQTYIPEGGAYDSTTFDPRTKTADPWNNGRSSWIFAFGGDTVKEAVVVPEEIRAKLPGDYGRSKGMAWYYLGGFGLVHTDPEDARVIKWDSAA